MADSEIAHVYPDITGLELVSRCGGGEDGLVPVGGGGVERGDGVYFL